VAADIPSDVSRVTLTITRPIRSLGATMRAGTITVKSARDVFTFRLG
jgi:hypothetical protein